GVTARLDPPLDPQDNLGYFEYIENCQADAQGEDTDDCLRFTVQAPANQPFTGRMFVVPPTFLSMTAQQQTTLLKSPAFLQTPQTMITSEYAEVIYFLRTGTLYRRVLLIAPERQAAVDLAFNAVGFPPNLLTGMIPTGSVAPGVSWLGLNDLSAHPPA